MSKDESKLGLCLSGGGFRAALFHIGTLAALAERELLHKVEVISTVSGGSIIGAYYYLKVKQLLEGKRTEDFPEPNPAAYIRIVKEVEHDFLSAVQKNLRARLFLNPLQTARMLLDEDFSRSDRMSQLLDIHFYNSISLVDRIKLKDIHITPPPRITGKYQKDKGGFSASKYNESETYKIPVLTINATCLNTGHPWEFTGSWVGEAERKGLYSREQNTIHLLPQLRFDDTYDDDKERKNESWQNNTLNTIWLSDAVAASAAVPGLFPPLPIHELYRISKKDDFVVELCDGGVFDNQGLVALLSAHCTCLFASDATGQFVDESLLSTSMVSIVQRANAVMMERIRGYGFFDLGLRPEVFNKLPATDPLNKEIYFVQDSAYTHLREVAANGVVLPGPGDKEGGMVYCLSGMRTDLDSFSDMEACTLMYQAYSLAKDKLRNFCPECGQGSPKVQQWTFLEIADVIKNDQSRLAKHLAVAKQMLFKTFRLAPVKSWALASVPIALVLYCLYINWFTSIKIPLPGFTVGELFVYALISVVVMQVFNAKVRVWLKKIRLLRKFTQNWIFLAAVTVISALAWLVVFVHLCIFNPLFLKVGKLKRS
jgi:predicted acylesterase/phospholipase RssA